MKPILLLILVVILSNTILAYVMPEYYKGVQIKFYDEVNKTWCYEMFDSIPDKYYEKLNYIKIYDSEARRDSKRNAHYYFISFDSIMGLYYIHGGIALYNDCTQSTFIHELAHHCQMQRDDLTQEALDHSGNFGLCKDEIWRSIR